MPSIVVILTKALVFTFFLTLKQCTARPTSHSVIRKSQVNTINDGIFNTHCNETCGGVKVTFPFYINKASCGWSTSFQLSCVNSTSLFLNIDSQNYRVIEFFSDGVLVDFPGFLNVCRPYNDLRSFGFSGNDLFGISSDNVIGLYDCEDSSLCKANCEANDLPDCEGNGSGNGLACCYPLSDHSVWQIGDGFGLFSKFECRGFSSWVVPRGVSAGKRGVKLEWALPLNSSTYVCDVNARSVNATTVKHGVRCICGDGFVGDGYVNGTMCFKSCFKDGKEEFGDDCDKRHHNTKIIILTGVVASVFGAASLITLFCLIKRAMTSTGYGSQHKPHFRSTLSFRKSCNTRIFTLNELDEATKGFDEGQKLMDSVFTGTLRDGTHIAVQKVHCDNEYDLLQVLTRIELLSSILHPHLARIFGCCIDAGHIPMVVYEFPQNGTLKDHLHQGNKEGKMGLDWYKRLSICAQTASLLAYLQHEVTPAVFHHDLNSSIIFLDQDHNVKVACFGMLSGSKLYKSDVYGLGLVLLEVISGGPKQADNNAPTTAMQKIRDGKLEEVLDPLLYYHEQPPFRKDEIEIVADIATRCLLFGGDGKLRMVDVARELVHLMKASIDGGSGRGPALEVTFSNSSLLQMVSLSPDSIHLPRD